MEKGELIKRCKTEIEEFLNTVSSDTLDGSYDKLIHLILPYRGLLTKDDLYAIFIAIDKERKLNDFQEEVIWDISNRLDGHCSPGQEIDL